MAEFGISKIMDGIFIADQTLASDFDFLISNKVSHLVVWTPDNVQINYQQSNVKVLKYPKCQLQGLLPRQSDLEKLYNFIQESRQQFLCCLICSDLQSEAAMLLSAYFMKKFHWDLKSTFDFIHFRFSCFNPRVEIVQQLQDFQLKLQQDSQNQKLRCIEFSYDFLVSYQTEDIDQKLLLNTIKNVLIQNLNFGQSKKNYNKRRKRVQWNDRIRPSTSLKSFNCKYAVYNRNLSLKPKNKNINKQFLKPYQLGFQQQNKLKLLKRSSDLLNTGQFFMDDLQFQSLKQLTRTKLYQSQIKGSLRKRSSLKLLKKQNSSKQNKQLLCQNIKKKKSLQLKGVGSQGFLKNLASINRLKLSSTGLNA